MKTALLVSLFTVTLAAAPGCEGKKDSAAAGGAPQTPAPGVDPRGSDRGGTRAADTTAGNPKPRAPGDTPSPKPKTDPLPQKPAAGQAQRDRGPALLAELEKLPVGITVVHTPAKLKARKNVGALKNIDPKWTYYWAYQTSVSAAEKPLTIVAFGSCEWIDGKWAIPQDTEDFDVISGSGKEFGEWYTCPDARLETGKEYKDPDNWSGSKTVRAFKQKWYYVGKDKDGNRYKGEAEVELLGELDAPPAKEKPGPGK